MIVVSEDMGILFSWTESQLLNEYANIVSGLNETLAEHCNADEVKKKILSITMDVLSGELKEIGK